MKMAHPKHMHAGVPLFCMMEGCGCRLPGESFRSERNSSIPKLGRITGGSPSLRAQGTWGPGTLTRHNRLPNTVPSMKKPVQEAATSSPGALHGPMGEVRCVLEDTVHENRTNERKVLEHGFHRQAERRCETMEIWVGQFICPRVEVTLDV